MRIALGIAPMYGPKTGMTFVTPTIVAMSTGYGRRRMLMPMKHSTPMMSESKILPRINPPKMRLARRDSCRMRSARAGFQMAMTHFFACARKRSREASRYTEIISPTTTNMTHFTTENSDVVTVTMTFCTVLVRSFFIQFSSHS